MTDKIPVPMQHGMGLRFRVAPTSMSGHDCCFAATVVDVAYNEVLAECRSVAIAEAIAEAMNKFSAEVAYDSNGHEGAMVMPLPQTRQ